MKRRSFLATIAGIIAAPFVAKKAIAETPAAKPYTVAVDWDSHRWELSKWQAWNEKMEEMTKTNLLSPPKP
jgi:hypothetical protein